MICPFCGAALQSLDSHYYAIDGCPAIRSAFGPAVITRTGNKPGYSKKRLDLCAAKGCYEGKAKKSRFCRMHTNQNQNRKYASRKDK